MSAAVAEQGTFDLFEAPYRSKFRYSITWCGCCQRWAFGYDATCNGHNVCQPWRERGLGCECMTMMLTLNHIVYHLARINGDPDRDVDDRWCWCTGDTNYVCGSGKKHRSTPEHRASQLANYYLPRVLATWPQERHPALRRFIDALARYHGVLDLLRGDK